MHANVADFSIRGGFFDDFGTLQSAAVCADAQCFKITWLEELASETNTTGMKRYYWAGKIAGPDTRKLYINI